MRRPTKDDPRWDHQDDCRDTQAGDWLLTSCGVVFLVGDINLGWGACEMCSTIGDTWKVIAVIRSGVEPIPTENGSWPR